MPRGLGRLPFLKRRSRSESPANDRPLPDAPIDPDAAPVGPPVLLPSAIIRQVLVEATEVTPIWARPRPEPEPLADAPVAATPKRTRRAKAVDSNPKETKPASTARRTRRSRPATGDT